MYSNEVTIDDADSFDELYGDVAYYEGEFEFGEDSINTLISMNIETLQPYLNTMFWVDANVVYLNQGFFVPQTAIAKYLDMSQLGVSKRLHQALERLGVMVARPTTNISEVRDFLSQLFNMEATLILLSVFNTMSVAITSLALNKPRKYVKDIIVFAHDYLSTLAKGQISPILTNSTLTRHIDLTTLTEDDFDKIKSYSAFYSNLKMFCNASSHILRSESSDAKFRLSKELGKEHERRGTLSDIELVQDKPKRGRPRIRKDIED